MSAKAEVKPKRFRLIREKEPLRLVGCVYYGDPFHSTEGFREENEIELTWQRYADLYEKHRQAIERYRIQPSITYELHIEPQEYTKTKNFYMFVGARVSELRDIPLEMFGKTLPPATYAVFTFRGRRISKGGEYIWKKWLPQSDRYQEAFPYFIQAYDSVRFRALGDEASELDYYVPIRPKE
jgi:AraC family transcriptional regulator